MGRVIKVIVGGNALTFFNSGRKRKVIYQRLPSLSSRNPSIRPHSSPRFPSFPDREVIFPENEVIIH
jgi:hypothetical protein